LPPPTSIITIWSPKQLTLLLLIYYNSECIPGVDVDDLKLENTTEFFQKVKTLAEPLAQHIPLVMVTLGKLGIMLISRLPVDLPVKEGLKRPLEKSEARFYPTQPAEGIVNVSGAGDCSVAGFINGFLNGLTEPECVSLANFAAFGALQSISAVPDNFNIPTAPPKKDFKVIY